MDQVIVNTTYKERKEGCQRLLHFDRYQYCSNCEGEGVEPNPCEICRDTGIYLKVEKNFWGSTVRTPTVCYRCKGTDKCRTCNGLGTLFERVEEVIDIPANSSLGDEIEYHGIGDLKFNGGWTSKESIFVLIAQNPDTEIADIIAEARARENNEPIDSVIEFLQERNRNLESEEIGKLISEYISC